MPLMKTSRNTRVAASGYVIVFEADKPVYVPDAMVEAAVGVGATLVDGKVPEPPKGEPSRADRGKIIAEMTAKIAQEHKAQDFTATGAPSLRKLSELCGFDVETKERDTAWTEFQKGVSE